MIILWVTGYTYGNGMANGDVLGGNGVGKGIGIVKS